MLKTAAIIYGAAFLLTGVVGFIPAAAPGELLFGVFHVNATHNILHLVTGLIGLAAGIAGTLAAKLYFETFGVLYACLAFLRFAQGHDPVFGFVANNLADAWLHVLASVVALFFGFGWEQERRRAGSGGTH